MLRLTPLLVSISACQSLAVSEFEPGIWNRQVHFPVYNLLGEGVS
jgi:hypothetical protein